VGAVVSGAVGFKVSALCVDDGEAAGQKLVAKVRGELIQMYRETPCMPIMIRLAWHDAGTYNAIDGTGGANGSIRFTPESEHGANAGLAWARSKLEDIKAIHSAISYADLYQLASVVAVEFMGGPAIPFRLGRKDAQGPDQCTPDGRLPDATKTEDHLRDIFYRMGFVDKDIVALSGAHCVGRAHADRSGFEGAWSSEPLSFSNDYFTELLRSEATPGLLKLPSDVCLVQDPSFRRWVEAFAANEELFFECYAASHQKLSELGNVF
jgi:L-ascorbate peroxidase